MSERMKLILATFRLLFVTVTSFDLLRCKILLIIRLCGKCCQYVNK